jgi:aminoglycoside/choline kinase family phosphotransferase
LLALENGKIINLMKFKILPIEADASHRKFYRIILNNKSKIIVSAKKDKYKNLIAYTSVNKFLRKNHILAPRLLGHNYLKGVIIIEDFGNTSFHKILLKKKNKFKIYKKLLNLLLKIQKIKPKRKIKSINKEKHIIEKYSIEHLIEESNLFFDWYLPLFLKKKKALNIKKLLKKTLLRIYKKLYFPNSCFVHRDYHVQNLMKVGNNVGIIDTQDALIGNPAYDLVSLIDDVRIKTSLKLKNQMYDYYLKNANRVYKTKNFLQDFNILSVQRSLKILGIFARLYKRDKKNKYLKFIPYTWQLLETRMHSPIFLELKKILDKNIKKEIRKKIIKK